MVGSGAGVVVGSVVVVLVGGGAVVVVVGAGTVVVVVGGGAVVVVVGGGAVVVVVVGAGAGVVADEPAEPAATPPGPKSFRNALYEFGFCCELSAMDW